MSKSITTDRHANARDRKRAKAREMLVSGKGAFVVQAVIEAKAAEAARNLAALAEQKAKRRKP